MIGLMNMLSIIVVMKSTPSRLFLFTTLLTLLCIFSCSDDHKDTTDLKLKDKIIRKGEYKNGKFTGTITKIDPLGDTISVKKYVGGQTGIIKYYNDSGHISSMTAFVVGTSCANAFVDFDESEQLFRNSNIRLYQKKNKLVVMFYTPYPDELKLVFKTNFKKKGSKIIEEREIKSFNKQRIEIDLNKRYYTKGRLNLIVDLIWQERPNIKTSHEVYVQLDKNEAPDYYNIDAITPDL